MKYEEIYSRFYLKETDPGLFELSQDDAYDRMCGWMHSVAAIPHVRKCFLTLTFNDEINELTFDLVNSIDTSSDEDFVKEVFAQGMVIGWMRPQVESVFNTSKVLGTKEEKIMLNNYKPNKERLETLEKSLKKFIRDYGYFNNSHLGES